MAGGRKFMFLFNKKMLAVSLTGLLILCAGCNRNVSIPKSENNGSINNEVAVNNAKLPEVNDDIAPSDDEKIEIKLGLVKNSASALGAAHLFINSEDNSAYERYTPVVYNSYNELYTAFINGEIAVAVLPPDKAAMCYSNVNCYVTAVTGGSNYYIAENGNTVNDIVDLNGKTITVSKEDTMAESVLNVIANSNNINVAYNRVDTNAQLISGLKDGSIDFALTQEPYLSQVTGDNIRSALDLYDFWMDVVKEELVTSCLIVNKNFVSEEAIPFQFFMKDFAASASIAKRNTEETAKGANKFVLIDDVNTSKAAIPGCGIMFKTGGEMKKMLTAFYKYVAADNADILGGYVPDDAFYFVKE